MNNNDKDSNNNNDNMINTNKRTGLMSPLAGGGSDSENEKK